MGGMLADERARIYYDPHGLPLPGEQPPLPGAAAPPVATAAGWIETADGPVPYGGFVAG